MLSSGFIEFELEYSKTINLSIGDVVRSDVIFAGGHVWRIYCYPHGNKKDNKGTYLSLYIRLSSAKVKMSRPSLRLPFYAVAVQFV
jgi:speckle-type POZ protein